MQFFGQYYEIRDNEVNGFNHPTQALIDDQMYVRGTNFGPFTTITPTATSHIYGFQTLNGPSESSRGEKLSLQLITTVNVNPDFKIVNYQFYEHIKSRKNEAYGYDEFVPDVNLYDTRTELHYGYCLRLFGQDTENHDIGGVAFRAQWGKQFSDFSLEPYAAYDLLQNPRTFNITVPLGTNPLAYGPGGIFGGYPIKRG